VDDVLNEIELFRVRVALVQAFLREKNLDGVLLTRPDNFAMATGGKRNFIWTHTDLGSNALYVDKEGRVSFVGNNIEEGRLRDEELGALGTAFHSFHWWEGAAAACVKQSFTGNIASDDGSVGQNVHAAMAPLRALLTETELEKYRQLGRLAASVDGERARFSIKEGDLEADIAARLVAEGAARRCQVPVALIAADDRIAQYRHPLPTIGPLLRRHLAERGVEKYVMVVGCFLREGLVVSLTRFKKVATSCPRSSRRASRGSAPSTRSCRRPPSRARRSAMSLGRASRPMQRMGFAANEWHNHHQGGATGYAGRTAKGLPGEAFPVLDTYWPQKAGEILGKDIAFGAAYAWNPSGPGVKSEDTFILRADGMQEIVSSTPSLPQIPLSEVLNRPTSVIKSGIAE
jgi:Xaa-Pro dipeptidase